MKSTVMERIENYNNFLESEKIYYMAYESWDYESHYPCGIFKNLKILKEKIMKEYENYESIEVYEIKLNEHFNFYDLEQIKFWWKEE